MNTPSNESSLVISYLGLRKAIGLVGFGLPFVLVIGKQLLDGPGLEPSIGAYYYTVMRDVFVGSLCAIGMFLMSYRGYEPSDNIDHEYELSDNIFTKIASVCAVGVALFPTAPESNPSLTDITIAVIHYVFATYLFITFAIFCLVLFRKTDPSKPMTRRKKQRNVVYMVCGYGICLCILLLAIYGAFLRGTVITRLNPVFWLETGAILCFAISWLVKGKAVLGDES